MTCTIGVRNNLVLRASGMVLLLVGLVFALEQKALAVVVSFQQGFNLTGTSTPYTGTLDTFLGVNTVSSVTTQYNDPTAAATNTFTFLRNRFGTGDNLPSIGRVLLKFDGIFGSDAGLISSNQIVSATLRVANSVDVTEVLSQQALLDWTPTDVSNYAGGALYGPDGTEIGPSLGEGTETPVSGTVEYIQWDVTSIVQAWADNASPNYGFALISANSDGVVALSEFTSGFAGLNASARPLLTVEFTPFVPAPEPSSLLLLGLGTLGLVRQVRARQRRA